MKQKKYRIKFYCLTHNHDDQHSDITIPAGNLQDVNPPKLIDKVQIPSSNDHFKLFASEFLRDELCGCLNRMLENASADDIQGVFGFVADVKNKGLELILARSKSASNISGESDLATTLAPKNPTKISGGSDVPGRCDSDKYLSISSKRTYSEMI